MQPFFSFLFYSLSTHTHTSNVTPDPHPPIPPISSSHLRKECCLLHVQHPFPPPFTHPFFPLTYFFSLFLFLSHTAAQCAPTPPSPPTLTPLQHMAVRCGPHSFHTAHTLASWTHPALTSTHTNTNILPTHGHIRSQSDPCCFLFLSRHITQTQTQTHISISIYFVMIHAQVHFNCVGSSLFGIGLRLGGVVGDRTRIDTLLCSSNDLHHPAVWSQRGWAHMLHHNCGRWEDVGGEIWAVAARCVRGIGEGEQGGWGLLLL